MKMIEIYYIINISFSCFCSFYARDSGLLKFRMYAGMLGRTAPTAARRLVAFTFHPTDPFAISVQRTNAEYIVSFHVRHI
jgi:de-etiolated-1